MMGMIRRTKGNVITFTSKKVAVHAGIPPHPVVLTLVKDVLENLRKEGYIKRLAKTSHGTKYMVDRTSIFWKASKDEKLIYQLRSPYLQTIIARIVEE